MINYIKNDVITWVNDNILPATSKPANAAQIVARFLLEKCTKSLNAVCELCSNDFGEDALIIARSIYENALTLAYICKPYSDVELSKFISSEELARIYILYGFKEQLSKQDQISKLNQDGKCKEWEIDIDDYHGKKQVREDNETVAKLITELDKLRDKSKQFMRTQPKMKPKSNEWNLLSLKNTAAIVGAPYECDYHYIYWSVSHLVHPSPLGGFYYANRAGAIDSINHALLFGYNYYSKLLFNVNKIFALGQEKVVQAREDRFVVLYNEQNRREN